MKGYLVWSRKHLLQPLGIVTIYPRGSNSGVSPSKIYFFSVDEMHDYYLQTWDFFISKTDTFKLVKPDLVRIRYQNMRIFPGNFIHGEGFKDEISTGNFRIQLMIMNTNIRISKCNIFYNEKFEYVQVTEKDMKDFGFKLKFKVLVILWEILENQEIVLVVVRLQKD